MARGKGEVLLDLDGKRYTLVFDMEAVAAFEDETDLSIFEFAASMAQQQGAGRPPKLSMLGSLLKAGLARHHPELTRADAMALMVNPGTQGALAKAFELAMPPAEDSDGAGADETGPTESGEAKGLRTA